MKNVSQKSKSLCIFCVFVLAIISVSFVFAHPAYAKMEDDDPTIQDVYYFSDSDDSNALADEILRPLFDEYPLLGELHVNCYSDFGPSDSLLMIRDFVRFNKIENDIVIIEVSQYPKLDSVNTGDGYYYTEDLLTIFSKLKGDGCRTMLISGLAEQRLEREDNVDGTQFLDYVDIHVNLDVLYYFYRTVFDEIKDESDISDCTIIVNGYLAQQQNNFAYWSFYKNALIPYILFNSEALKSDTYKDLCEKNHNDLVMEWVSSQDREEVYQYDRQVLLGSNIKVLLQSDGDIYYDVVNEKSVYLDSGYSVLYGYGSDYYYVIGTRYDYDSVQTEEKMIAMRDIIDLDMVSSQTPKIYSYITTGSEPFDNFDPDIKYAGVDATSLMAFLEPIITDFVGGGDLSQYDNISGRCIVTAFPIDFDGSGWLKFYGYAEEYDRFPHIVK